MIDGILFLNYKGDVLVSRQFRPAPFSGLEIDDSGGVGEVKLIRPFSGMPSSSCASYVANLFRVNVIGATNSANLANKSSKPVNTVSVYFSNNMLSDNENPVAIDRLSYADDDLLISPLIEDLKITSVQSENKEKLSRENEFRNAIVRDQKVTFFHLHFNSVYMVTYVYSVPGCLAKPTLIFEFMRKFLAICHDYIKDSSSSNPSFNSADLPSISATSFVDPSMTISHLLTEQWIRNNFILIYELLDEILDFGYPQITETSALKMFISDQELKREQKIERDPTKITVQTTGAISWRRQNIRYRKNEAYLDVIETINALVKQDGTVLQADISGKIVMRAFLSGMPECKLGLNDKLQVLERRAASARKNSMNPNARPSSQYSRNDYTIELDDLHFHQCVRLGRFSENRTITFTPPDGEFELMKYRIGHSSISLPFTIQSFVNDDSQSHIEYRLTVKSCFNHNFIGRNCKLLIPTPPNCLSKPKLINCQQGVAKYIPENDHILWKIPKFPGADELNFCAIMEKSPMVIQRVWVRPPIIMEFSLDMWTGSGINIHYLKVLERSIGASYSSVKWVRYLSRSGIYQYRF